MPWRIPYYLSFEYNAVRYEHDELIEYKKKRNSIVLDDILDTVDDVTIGYEGNIPENELSLLKGQIPKAIHFHVKRHPISDIPQTDAEVGEWLQECWHEKEARLRE